MDDNRKEGAKRELSGAVMDGFGKVTGDRSQQLEGKIENNTGKVQREIGEAADDVRESNRDTR